MTAHPDRATQPGWHRIVPFTSGFRRSARRIAGIASVLALTAGAVPELSAQEVPLPAPDSRARFLAVDPETGRLRSTVGTVVSADPDSLSVRADRGGAVAAAAWHHVTRLDQSAGVWSRPATVAVAALTLGAAGAALGWFAGQECSDPPIEGLCISPREEAAVTMGILGIATGIAGGLIVPRRERWSERPMPTGVRLDVAVAGRPGLGVSLAF